MKYYSEKLNKIFNTEKELVEAEAKKNQEQAAKDIAKQKIKKSFATITKEFNNLINIMENEHYDWSDAEQDELISEVFAQLIPLMTKIRLM